MNNMDEAFLKFQQEIAKSCVAETKVDEKPELCTKIVYGAKAVLKKDSVKLEPVYQPEPVIIPAAADHISITKIEKKTQKSKIVDLVRKKEKIDLDQKPKKLIRSAGGDKWYDPNLEFWDKNDYRIFCGDLGNDTTDELLAQVFRKYKSFIRARVVRDKRSDKSKGFGFVSLGNAEDFVMAMREMNGKYVGSRPIKLRKSCWQDRSLHVIKKKDKAKKKLGFK